MPLTVVASGFTISQVYSGVTGRIGIFELQSTTMSPPLSTTALIVNVIVSPRQAVGALTSIIAPDASSAPLSRHTSHGWSQQLPLQQIRAREPTPAP